MMNSKFKIVIIALLFAAAGFVFYYTRPQQKIKRIVNKGAVYIEKNQTMRLALIFSDDFRPYNGHGADDILMALKSSGNFWGDVNIDIAEIDIQLNEDEAVANVSGSLLLNHAELGPSEDLFRISLKFLKETQGFKLIEIINLRFGE